MAIFWVQTMMRYSENEFVKLQIDAPFSSIEEFAKALSTGAIVSCDKIWTRSDGGRRKIITKRERIAIGAGYVGMLQMPGNQPCYERS